MKNTAAPVDYVDNSLPRVPAHTHYATTTELSLRNPMVDPKRSFRVGGLILYLGVRFSAQRATKDAHMAKERAQRKLTAILAADVVSYASDVSRGPMP
jgi:hypothetical protein